MIRNLSHAVASVVVHLAVGLLLGQWLLGALLPVAFYAGREHAQAEYRWIATWGQRKRANMPWWGGFDPRVWDTHSLWWNLSFPAVCVSIIYLFKG